MRESESFLASVQADCNILADKILPNEKWLMAMKKPLFHCHQPQFSAWWLSR
jgi:hypothetical protein